MPCCESMNSMQAETCWKALQIFVWQQANVRPPAMLVHFLSSSLNLLKKMHRLNGEKMHAAQAAGTISMLTYNHNSPCRSVCVPVWFSW